MRIFLYCLALTLTFILPGCSHSDSPADNSVNPDKVERVVLVYAVNKSTLSPDFGPDQAEMIQAFKETNQNKYQLLLFRTDSDTECGLYKAVNSGDATNFELVKKYPRNVAATNPNRIKEVLIDALAKYPNAIYTLFFWGHGTSWTYYDNSHLVSVNTPEVYGYGGEITPSHPRGDYTNIDELADAIPDNRFETIWFDCCFMSGIETIYELRNKARYFVGYPTEVWATGAPYDKILKWLFQSNPDLIAAARTFFNSYAGEPATVAVADLSKIEPVADIASKVYASGNALPDKSELLNYSRGSLPNYYDFRQLLSITAALNNATYLIDQLDRALDNFILYHAESATNFNNKPWNVANISGVNSHYYSGGFSTSEEYYRSLDWFKRVY